MKTNDAGLYVACLNDIDAISVLVHSKRRELHSCFPNDDVDEVIDNILQNLTIRVNRNELLLYKEQGKTLGCVSFSTKSDLWEDDGAIAIYLADLFFASGTFCYVFSFMDYIDKYFSSMGYVFIRADYIASNEALGKLYEFHKLKKCGLVKNRKGVVVQRIEKDLRKLNVP